MPQSTKKRSLLNRAFSRLLRRRGKQKGLALIIALAIMALLVLLGTAFSLSAIYAADGAQLSSQLIKTRLLMESATQEAIATVTLSFNDVNNLQNMMPATKPGQGNKYGLTTASAAWDGRYYWTSSGDDNAGLAEAFEHTVAGINITPDASSALLSTDTPGWIHIQDSEGSSAITGRYSYLVIDESGQIDMNAAIQNSSVEGSVAETNSRLGASPSEINLRHVTPTNPAISNLSTGDAFASSLQWPGVSDGSDGTGVDSGQLPSANLNWLSRHYLFQENSLAASNLSQINMPGLFLHSLEIDAFYDGKDYHRYNLAHTDWDSYNNSVSASGITADASEYWDGNGGVADNDGGIPWISKDTTQTNQIAANIIDFADSDSIATTDDAADPTYVGLEKVPYLNEVAFSVAMSPPGPGIEKLTITAWVELANIYLDDLGQGGRITLTYDFSSDRFSAAGQTFTWNVNSDLPSQRYSLMPPQSRTTNIGNVNSVGSIMFTNLTLSFTDTSGDLWDFAHLPDMVLPGSLNAVIFQDFNAIEVKDPRHNTPASQWGWLGWGSAGTPAQRNTRCDAPTVDADKEVTDYMGDTSLVTADTINLSTAYIRNAPFSTLWQLGCIHRGKAWNTLRIHKYDVNAFDRTDIGTWFTGDATILDQVKLGDDDAVVGRVNINTYNKCVIRALLTGLRLTGDWANPTDPSVTAITEANSVLAAETAAGLVSGDWFFENGAQTDLAVPFFTRAQLAQVTRLQDGTLGTQDTDATMEELIGKIAGISSTRSNYFTLILISQTVKDLPTGYQGGTRGVFDDGVDKIIAENRTRILLRRDAYTNTLETIRFDVFID